MSLADIIHKKLTPIQRFMLKAKLKLEEYSPPPDENMKEDEEIYMDVSHICGITSQKNPMISKTFAVDAMEGVFSLQFLKEIVRSFDRNGVSTVKMYLKKESPLVLIGDHTKVNDFGDHTKINDFEDDPDAIAYILAPRVQEEKEDWY